MSPEEQKISELEEYSARLRDHNSWLWGGLYVAALVIICHHQDWLRDTFGTLDWLGSWAFGALIIGLLGTLVLCGVWLLVQVIARGIHNFIKWMDSMNWFIQHPDRDGGPSLPSAPNG